MGLIGAMIGNAGPRDTEDLARDYGELLAEGERIEMGFKVIRDACLFTDRRVILIDRQGVTGKKTEILSVPYRAISHFSLESAGHLDLESELRIWVTAATEPTVRTTFDRSVDVCAIQRLLAAHVAG